MSVWPVTPSLSTAEGTLISISIDVEPHSLESLLDALAQISFPVNPQIYHDAVMVYRYADGREEKFDLRPRLFLQGQQYRLIVTAELLFPNRHDGGKVYRASRGE